MPHQDVVENLLGRLPAPGILAVETLLGHLDIPIAEIAPNKLVQLVAAMPNSKFSRSFVTLRVISWNLVRIQRSHNSRFSAAGTPSGTKPSRFISTNREAFQILLTKLRKDSIFSSDMRTSLPGDHAHLQREAQRVRAVLVDDLDRINAVAQGFGHLAPLRIAHQAVHQGHMERALPHLLQAGKHHARQPEEDDIVSAAQYGIGIEILEILGFLGQPSVENGHSAEENQVSSTSSSCRTGAPHLGQVVISSRETVISPH